MNTILHLLYRNQQVSLSRMNDGEIGAVMGDLTKTSRGKQVVTPSLIQKINYAIDYRDKNYFIGIPCPVCFPKYFQFTRDRLKGYKNQILSVSTSNNHYHWFKKELLRVLEGKKVAYIGCSECDIIWLEEHFTTHNLFRNTDTDLQTDEILEYCDQILSEIDVFLFAVGAISRYLVAILHQKGASAIDVGSLFDPETRGVYLRPHKWISPYKNEQVPCPICNY